jgi:predicted nucleic acid-binding protein
VTALDWERVFVRAVGISAQHSASTLARSLDVLHVAAALEAGCTSFVTADRRQAALAEAAGMAVIGITKEGPPRASAPFTPRPLRE